MRSDSAGALGETLLHNCSRFCFGLDGSVFFLVSIIYCQFVEICVPTLSGKLFFNKDGYDCPEFFC